VRERQGGREGGAITTRGSRWLRSNVLGLVAIYIALRTFNVNRPSYFDFALIRRP
jgi:hypothetical protein